MPCYKIDKSYPCRSNKKCLNGIMIFSEAYLNAFVKLYFNFCVSCTPRIIKRLTFLISGAEKHNTGKDVGIIHYLWTQAQKVGHCQHRASFRNSSKYCPKILQVKFKGIFNKITEYYFNNFNIWDLHYM